MTERKSLCMFFVPLRLKGQVETWRAKEEPKSVGNNNHTIPAVSQKNTVL